MILAWQGVALAQAGAPITGQWRVGALAGDPVLLNIQRMNVNSKMNHARDSERVPWSEPRTVRFAASLVRFELVGDREPSVSTAMQRAAVVAAARSNSFQIRTLQIG